MDEGADVLAEITKSAVKRFLESDTPLFESDLFSEEEAEQLVKAIESTNATANLLGRSRIRKRLETAEKYGEIPEDQETDFSVFKEPKKLSPLEPEKAVEYFKNLVPGLSVNGEQFATAMRRQAFTLAATTEQRVLEKVKGVIQEALQTGEGISTGPKMIERILDRAGVLPSNKQYSEMAFRTNMMNAYNEGASEELRNPDVIEAFPVWKYAGIEDGRQRPAHEKHFGRYYPSDMTFEEVRDSEKGEFDGFQCRCTFIPIFYRDWEKLQQSGAHVSTFSETEKFCGGKGSGVPGPCPTGKSKSVGKAKGKKAPEPPPVEKTPFEGKTKDEIIAAWSGLGTALQPGYGPHSPSLDPWGYKGAVVRPEVKDAVLSSVDEQAAQNKFKMLTIREVYEKTKEANPALQLKDFHKQLTALEQSRTIRLEAASQAIAILPEKELPFVFPLDSDVKMYVRRP